MMHGIDETHDPQRTSWVAAADGHRDFPIQNLPFGIVSVDEGAHRIGVAIGDEVLDVAAIAPLLPDRYDGIGNDTLNALFALPAERRTELRRRLSLLLSDPVHRDTVASSLIPRDRCRSHLPFAIRDYTDFYVGIHHAENVGKLFRPDNPLLPNYKWVPIGYHGRASSVRPSGVPVTRPKGQILSAGATTPTYAPSRRLDFELELGAWIAHGNALGHPIAIADARSHIAGLSLLNDWSARDIQAWEYQPLGPFLAKNFHTSVSPWVVTVDALAPFTIPQPPRPSQDPGPLPYLYDDRDQADGAFAIELEVTLASETMRAQGIAPVRLSRSYARHMYWTVSQLLTHHSSNGCDLDTGDLLGTGTISAPSPDGFGSLLEITRGGTAPITLPTEEQRDFLADGDEITLTATAAADGFVPIGFGACRATIQPAVAS